ncbi:MAG TPA: polysaccharide biosynthesis/export family protein [Pyrinomonadaceae bacterium]|nr:polysaccharide biosynthesis/export family protein [Pyrinomonadaceae bacterium]
MRKFLSAFVIASALCAAHAQAARAQINGVRVGPASDERVPDAPAAKKDEKKTPRPASERKGDRKDESASRKETKEGKQDTGAQTPSNISSNAAGVPPGTGDATPNTTSDAPSKSNPAAAVVPVSASTKPPANELGGPDNGKANDPTSPDTNGTNGTANNPGGTSSNPGGTAAKTNAEPALPPAPPLTSVYRIGVGDVLDIRILNQPDTRQSTLYTVLTGGVLEYPLLRNPLTVTGMTPEELALQMIAELKHRGVYDRPQVRVSVRDYASHAVLVSGLVSDPGTKILRREAVPLYVVVAEAQPKPEAGRAIVTSHTTGKTTSVDLTDATAMGMLVQQGDVVNLVARPPEFFYIGGEIASPGQKDFHPGMTLTQAVLASGGVTRLATGRVKVSRQGADGRLVSKEYNLKEIEDGVVPDPALQAGDRVEAARARK